ncbi:MAG: nickel pincer cofactor biosynthesis protein LarC [Pseudomonadota bacterium]
MPKALYYDCFSGISGDMHLGALLDLGVPEPYLQAELARMDLPGEFALTAQADQRKGLAGTRATVTVSDAAKPHRNLDAVLSIIASAGYEAGVETRATAMFEALATAEAAVHGVDVSAVHFHEVGATDAIVDIVGAALGLHHLEAPTVFCSPVEVGSGTVRCEHGLLPVPAPATARLLEGLPCHYGRVSGEATTPTGAAILKTVVTAAAPPASFTAQRWGHGIGQKDFEVANVLRIARGETGATDAPEPWTLEENLALESDLDDLSPEACEPLLAALWEAGVLDVQITPTAMKKQRPGFRISALLRESERTAVLRALFEHSTSIGARTYRVTKWMLPRRTLTVDTPAGSARAKIVTLPDGGERFKVEHDDVLRLSGNGRSYLQTRAVLEEAVRARLATAGEGADHVGDAEERGE